MFPQPPPPLPLVPWPLLLGVARGSGGDLTGLLLFLPLLSDGMMDFCFNGTLLENTLGTPVYIITDKFNANT